MFGSGLPAGRQLRVTGFPSRRTWSFSVIWKTGGKSEIKKIKKDKVLIGVADQNCGS